VLGEPYSAGAAPLKAAWVSPPLAGRALASLFVLVTVVNCGGSGTPSPIPSPGWGVPETLGTTGSLAPLAGDGNGDGVVAWLPLTAPDGPFSMVARAFAPATGWGPMATVVPSRSSTVGSPVAAMDPSGTAIVLWSGIDGFFATTSIAGGWGSPSLIAAPAGEFPSIIFPNPSFGFSAPGSALAIWTVPGRGLYASRLEPGLGWGAPTTVRSTAVADQAAPALAVTTTGFALAAWNENGTQIWWSTFDPSRGWAVAQQLQPTDLQLTDSSRPVYGVVAASNAAGDGVLAWIQHNLVFASHFTSLGGPEPPAVLGRGGPNGLAVDSAGNAVAALTQPGVTGAGLILRIYHPGQGWDDTPVVVSKDADALGALSMDALGNCWLVWSDSAKNVWAARYLSNQGLQPPQLLDNAGDSLAVFPQVVADTGGGAIAIWTDRSQTDVFTMRAARYVPPQVTQ
jgi:hypothetical protein